MVSSPRDAARACCTRTPHPRRETPRAARPSSMSHHHHLTLWAPRGFCWSLWCTSLPSLTPGAADPLMTRPNDQHHQISGFARTVQERWCQGPASTCTFSCFTRAYHRHWCQGHPALLWNRPNSGRTLVSRTHRCLPSACHIAAGIESTPLLTDRCRSVGELSLYPNLRKV